LRVVTVIATLAAIYLLYRNLSQYELEDITRSLAAIPVHRLLASAGFAAASYLCLSLFDLTALLYIGKRLAYPKILVTSFTALSIGHNIGFAALSSGAVRYRYYASWGLSAADVAKLIGFCSVTVTLGIVGLTGMALSFSPDEAIRFGAYDIPQSRFLGVALLAPVLFYPVLAALLPTHVTVWKWQLRSPDFKLAAAQVVIGIVNFALVGASLHQLVSGVSETGYIEVARSYSVANLAAIISHVPGGLGVLEATIAYAMPEAATIGVLIAFRVVYYLLPLAIGLPLFAGSEALRSWRHRHATSGNSSERQASSPAT
jgi:glycosyltransferase 2 family protein